MENQIDPVSQNNHKKSGNKAVVGALILVILSYYLGFKQGAKGYVFQPKEFKVVNQADQPQNVDYKVLWSAIDTVNRKYIEGSIDPQKTLFGAAKGAVGAAGDPYTEFFPPKEKDDFKTSLAGSFDGIGAEVGQKNGTIVIVAPLSESPAEKAGLRAKDVIVKVDGQSTQDWTVEDAVSKIRGQKGTEVTLTIYREGATSAFDVKIKRDTIKIKSVKWEVKQAGEKKTPVAVISISRFGDDTEGLFNQAVQEVLAKGIKGIILDLRNDPGGYLQTAVSVASNWVNKGDVVVTEAHTDPSLTQVFKASGNNRLSGIKTIVLINGGSASASEILSGALRDHNLATLLGEKSFGKGSVQELVDLPGGSAVKVTVAKWVTPGGKNLNHDGLNPDTEVKLSDDDIKNGKDSQMEKALEEIVK